MGITEMTQMGFFELFWNFSNWQLSAGVWFFAVLGFVIQWQLMKRCKGRGRLTLAGILAIGSTACETAVQLVTGWERLIPMLLYGIILSVSIGAGVAFVLCFFGPLLKREL